MKWPRFPAIARRRKSQGDLLVGVCALCMAVFAGCQQKMADQPSFKPLDPSPSSAHGASARLPVAGTVARGHLHTDWALFTGHRTPSPVANLTDREKSAVAPTTPGTSGKSGSAASNGGKTAPSASAFVPNSQATTRDLLAAELANYEGVVDEFPEPITEQTIQHGLQRYMIYCVECHDPAGTGHGKIVERGYTQPPSYHIARLRNAPVGHFFRVITLGYGSMPSYAAQIPPRDRWAIVAYIRALQLSRHFPEDQLPAEYRAQQSSGVPVPFAAKEQP
jgi:mono/diheme cytochrome c family protein